MGKVRYSIYRPAGNDTALVYGTNYTKVEKKKINDVIMYKHKNIEQVGFINIENKKELQMAGGEFCGNATRTAAYNYLKGKEGTMQIIVNSRDEINAGVGSEGEAWCEIPIYKNDTIIEREKGIFIVKMKGIVIVVIEEEQSKKFLENDKDLKINGKNLIFKYNLEENDAVGVIFLEKLQNNIKINPIVWVKSIDTLFYETACR